jgi:hypothetical protein
LFVYIIILIDMIYCFYKSVFRLIRSLEMDSMTILIDFSTQYFLDMHANTSKQGEQFPFYIYHILISSLHTLSISIYFSLLGFINLYWFLESNF